MLIVIDIEDLDVGWVKTVQSGKVSVRDQDGVTFGDFVQTSLVQVWQSDPVDGTDGAQGGEGKGGQKSDIVQFQGTGDGGDRVCSKSFQGLGVVDLQVTVDDLDVGNVGGAQLTSDDDVTLDGLTARQSVQVGLCGGSEGLGVGATGRHGDGGGGGQGSSQGGGVLVVLDGEGGGSEGQSGKHKIELHLCAVVVFVFVCMLFAD